MTERAFTHDQVRLFAAAIAKAMADRAPKVATIERLIRNRTGRVYVDYTQNGKGRTLASVYSPRARRGAPRSTPLRWDELETDIDPRQFTMDAVLKRVKKFGDLFESVLWDRQDITPFLAALRKPVASPHFEGHASLAGSCSTNLPAAIIIVMTSSMTSNVRVR